VLALLRVGPDADAKDVEIAVLRTAGAAGACRCGDLRWDIDPKHARRLIDTMASPLPDRRVINARPLVTGRASHG